VDNDILPQIFISVGHILCYGGSKVKNPFSALHERFSNVKLGRPRRRWVDNIRMDLQEVGCEYMDWIGLVQDSDRWRTLVSAVMNRRVP